MKSIVTWCVVPAILLAAAFAVAQPQNPGHQPPPRTGAPANWQDQDIREIVEMVMMVRLSKELELDDEQTVVLVRRFEGLKEKWTQARRQRQRMVDDLKGSLAKGADEAAIEEKLTRLVDFDVNLQKEKLGILQEAGQGLTVTQKAKLYVFVGEFEERLRNMVRRAREHQGAGPWPRGQAPDDGLRPMRDPGGEFERSPLRGRMAPSQAEPDRAVPKERPTRRIRDGVRQRGASQDAVAPSNEKSQAEDSVQAE